MGKKYPVTMMHYVMWAVRKSLTKRQNMEQNIYRANAQTAKANRLSAFLMTKNLLMQQHAKEGKRLKRKQKAGTNKTPKVIPVNQMKGKDATGSPLTVLPPRPRHHHHHHPLHLQRMRAVTIVTHIMGTALSQVSSPEIMDAPKILVDLQMKATTKGIRHLEQM